LVIYVVAGVFIITCLYFFGVKSLVSKK